MDNEKQKHGMKGIILDYPTTDMVTDPFETKNPPMEISRISMGGFDYCAGSFLILISFSRVKPRMSAPPTICIAERGSDRTVTETTTATKGSM